MGKKDSVFFKADDNRTKKFCGCCEKQFYLSPMINIREYLYRLKKENTRSLESYTYYCSYTCWRKAQQTVTRKGKYKRL